MSDFIQAPSILRFPCLNFSFKNVSGDLELKNLIFVWKSNLNVRICLFATFIDLQPKTTNNFYYFSCSYSLPPIFQLKFHLKNLFDEVLWIKDTEKKVRYVNELLFGTPFCKLLCKIFLVTYVTFSFFV